MVTYPLNFTLNNGASVQITQQTKYDFHITIKETNGAITEYDYTTRDVDTKGRSQGVMDGNLTMALIEWSKIQVANGE